MGFVNFIINKAVIKMTIPQIPHTILPGAVKSRVCVEQIQKRHIADHQRHHKEVFVTG